VTYPCSGDDDRDSASVFTEQFPPQRQGALRSGQHHPAAERPDAAYPFVLITGRQLVAWHTGSMNPALRNARCDRTGAVASLHSEDSRSLRCASGGIVQRGPRAAAALRSRAADDGIRVARVFIPFCFYEAAANLPDHPVLDPFGKIPIQVLRGSRSAGGPPTRQQATSRRSLQARRTRGRSL